MSALLTPPLPAAPPVVPSAAPLTPTPRLLTAADLAVLPDELPSGFVKYELDDGRLVIMPGPGGQHGKIQGTVVAHLKVQGEFAGHGETFGESGVILRRNPDRVVFPDACFVAKAALPAQFSPEGWFESMPTIVVEVRSKNDTVAELTRKAGEYLAAGVALVWILDPIQGNAVVLEAGRPPRTLGGADELRAGAFIPGFRLSVADALRE